MSARSRSENTAVGVVLTLVGAAATAAALLIKADYQGGWGPRLVPAMAAIGLLVLGVLDLVQARGQSPDPAGTPVEEPTGRHEVWRIVLLLVLSVAYVWLMSRAGYLLSTALAAPLVMLLFDVRKPLALAAACLLCPLAYHAIFFWGLGVFPPYAAWFDLADILKVN